MATTILILVCAAVTVTASDDVLDSFDWVVVGDPGNRDTIPEEVPVFPDWEIGGVEDVFRMTRTEVTVGQWVDFVNAYAPFHDGDPMDYGFVGVWIELTDDGYVVTPGKENFPQHMNWYMAARYCNWLHNGKTGEAWAFEDGAYDATGFDQEIDGVWGGPDARRAGAKAWILSEDEWVKGMYYDPDRYGPGEPGYWLYPDRGMEQMVSGYPEDGGETNAGIDEIDDFEAGQYVRVASPWGALDGSGGRQEWIEDLWLNGQRQARGSWASGGAWFVFDRIDFTSHPEPIGWYPRGVRLGSLPACDADTNADGNVNVLDVIAFVTQFQQGDEGADLNGDGILTVLDFVTFQVAVTAGCR